MKASPGSVYGNAAGGKLCTVNSSREQPGIDRFFQIQKNSA